MQPLPPPDDVALDPADADGLTASMSAGAEAFDLEEAGESDGPEPPRRPWLPHAMRAAVAVAFIVGLILLPDLTERRGSPTLAAYRGEIVEINANAQPLPDVGFEPNVRVRLQEGPEAGQIVDAYLEGPGGSLDVSSYRPGDEVVVTFTRTPDGAQFVAVSDRWRLPQLGGLALLFALSVVAVGGWRGLRALLALGLTIAVVLKLLLPLLINGFSPVPLAVAAATGITIATVVLTEGWSRPSVAAILGTAIALALTGLLGTFVTQIAGFTGSAASDLIFIQTATGGTLDTRGILLAAFILGSIGVLDDVTVTQAAFIDEVGTRAGLRGRELFGSALEIGRSHIAATVNTLFLAYVGAALPLLVVLIVSQQPAALVLNSETIAIEIVRTLVGSMGIVAAVPLTSVIATLMVDAATTARRRRPGDGRVRFTDPLPALLGGLAAVGLATAALALLLGPIGAAPSVVPRSPGPASPGGSRDVPTIAPSPSEDLVPIAVLGEPQDVVSADGLHGRVTVLEWDFDEPNAPSLVYFRIRYDAERPWTASPNNWGVLAESGEETIAVSGNRSPPFEGGDLNAGERLEGWLEAPVPLDAGSLFIVFRASDGTPLFALPLQ